MMRENESEPDIVTAPGRPRLLIYLLVAAVAAGLGAVAVTLAQHHDPAVASTHLNQAQVEREVTPGLVDIRANLQYSHEVSVDTGIVVSADGLVLTSNNDIVGSTSVKATLVGSGRTYTARVLGYDATQDVALLKLEGAAHLSAVTLGNSSPVTTGMLVLALGNAQGQGGVTPAAGIISALDRSISSGDGDQGLAVQNLRGIIPDQRPGRAGRRRRCAGGQRRPRDRHDHHREHLLGAAKRDRVRHPDQHCHGDRPRDQQRAGQLDGLSRPTRIPRRGSEERHQPGPVRRAHRRRDR